MARPAASSAALLMRRPLDSFWTLLEYVRAVADRFRWAVKASTLVLIRVDMSGFSVPLLNDEAVSVPPSRTVTPFVFGAYPNIIGRCRKDLRPGDGLLLKYVSGASRAGVWRSVSESSARV